MDESRSLTFADYQKDRPSAMVDRRQDFRHFFRHQPSLIQKWVRKFAWRSPFRHMHYFPPSIRLESRDQGVWELWRKGAKTRKFVSRPLTELQGALARPVTLVATGPSAKDHDWSPLKDGSRSLWAVNGAPTVLAAQGLHCDYLVITDHRFAKDGASHIDLALQQGAKLIFSNEAAAVFTAARPELSENLPFYVFEKVNCWYALPKLKKADLAAMNQNSGSPLFLPSQQREEVGWSHDPLTGVFAGKTVTFAALQVIVWAGASDIEVIGLDLGGKTRAYDEAAPAISHLETNRNFILPSFRCMAQALAGRPIRIITHSKVSPLPHNLLSIEGIDS